MRVERSDKAVDDVDEIWLFVAMDSERAADRLVDLLTAALRRLGDFPHMGVASGDLATDLRAMRTGSYVVYYRVTIEAVMIERILHARVDATSIAF